MKPFRFIPHGMPSSAPQLGRVHERLSKMHNGLRDTARCGSGLGPEEIEEVAREVGEIMGAIPANTGTERMFSINEVISRTWHEVQEAERALARVRNALRVSIDGDDADITGGARLALEEAMRHCLQAQGSLSAVRIARS